MNRIYKIEELNALQDKVIVITGARGMLGLAFREILSPGKLQIRLHALGREDLDVTNREKVLSLAELKPDLIIHCASLVNADYCEDHEHEANNVIVNGMQNIIDLAKLSHAKVMYPQSFLIYDGKESPITEETNPNPLSVYGKLKLKAENMLLRELPDSLVVRMSGFFGGREIDKNFVGKFTRQMVQVIKEGHKSISVGDRVWQPAFTNDLAYNSLLLLAHKKAGVYCMASHGKVSFFELAEVIASKLEYCADFTIHRVSSDTVARSEKAIRPESAIMENKKLKKEGLDRQRNWEEGIIEYIDHSYFKQLIQ